MSFFLEKSEQITNATGVEIITTIRKSHLVFLVKFQGINCSNTIYN